jgi:hypothetical protein
MIVLDEFVDGDGGSVVAVFGLRWAVEACRLAGNEYYNQVLKLKEILLGRVHGRLRHREAVTDGA